jgi:hypothetical protein
MSALSLGTSFYISTILCSPARTSDEVYPRQCSCLRSFNSWSVCGCWRIWRLQTETWHTREFTQVRPPEGKDLHPTCLILYCWYIWSCYNDAQMRSSEGGRRWRVLYFLGFGSPTAKGNVEEWYCNTHKFITNSKCPLCNPSQSQNHCCDLHNVVYITVIAINSK